MNVIGVDVGGTFTDIVLATVESETVHIHKVASTPDDPSKAVIQGIVDICSQNDVALGDVAYVLHGTTVATNAVLQYRGAKAGMITTAGYRDIIHIGRHQRPQHYSIRQEIPWQVKPLVKRRFRKSVPERVAPPSGEVLIPLDEEGVRTAARELKDAGMEAVAICFLFSYLNPTHEQRARKIVAGVFPQAFITTSSEVSPQFREFERFTTVAMNAFIGPLVRDYVNNLETAMRENGMSTQLHIMRSNGGVATVRTVSELPIYTLMSGLAAGVIGGAWIGKLAGRDNIITFDVGGTSADVGVVTQGSYAEASARDTYVGGYPIMMPMIDLHTIGAGGGSIAWVDEGGAFKVGPQSAGAIPGPAAYDRGGVEATVTDANLVLGRLDKDNFLGGAMTLDMDAAKAAVQTMSERLDLPLLDTAEGIITLLNANMANAIRARTVQKGIDPRAYCLVASGGAGPLHAAEIARMLDIPEVIVPHYPGMNSAIGLLTTDLKYDVTQTSFLLSTAMDYPCINSQFEEMEAQLCKQFEADGIEDTQTRYHRQADLRYVGQGYELRVPLPAGRVDETKMEKVLDRFHRLHHQEYGHSFPESPVEFVNIHTTGIGPMAKLERPPAAAGGTLDTALVKRAPTVFRVDENLREFATCFYRRDVLPLNEIIPGPAIVLQTDSTTVVPPDCSFRVDLTGILIIRITTTRNDTICKRRES